MVFLPNAFEHLLHLIAIYSLYNVGTNPIAFSCFYDGLSTRDRNCHNRLIQASMSTFELKRYQMGKIDYPKNIFLIFYKKSWSYIQESTGSGNNTWGMISVHTFCIQTSEEHPTTEMRIRCNDALSVACFWDCPKETRKERYD